MRQVVSRIKKRDGSVVDFVQDKITKAVYKAMESHDIVDEQAAKSVSDIVNVEAGRHSNFIIYFVYLSVTSSWNLLNRLNGIAVFKYFQ